MHWLLFGLQAWSSPQPAVTQPSQRNETGVQLPVWQIQPVSQSLFEPHGGRQACPVGSGAHFQPVGPQSVALVQVSQPLLVTATGWHSLVVVLHSWPLPQPVVVQSVDWHSVPVQARQVPLSQMSVPLQGFRLLQAVAVAHTPLSQVSPRPHA